MPTNPDISLSVNLGHFLVPLGEGKDLAFLDENGLEFDTGGNADYALGSTSITKAALATAVNKVQAGIVPQTLTVAYLNLHLVAGMTVNLNYNFTSADLNFNDFGFAVLADVNDNSRIQSALLADSKYYNQLYGNLGGYEQIAALFVGYHGGQHFTVDHTGNYKLVVGSADAGDKTAFSALKLTDVSLGLPGGTYTVAVGSSTAGDGLRLSDGSYLSINGSQYKSDLTAAYGTTERTALLAPAAQAIITAQYQAARNAIALAKAQQAASAGGLLGAQAGGVINAQAGGLPPLTALTDYLGQGLVPVNSSALISQDGGSVISRDGAGVISNDGGSVISNDGGSLLGLDGSDLISAKALVISNDGGSLITNDGGSLISQDGGSLISQDGGSLAGTGGTATFAANRGSNAVFADGVTRAFAFAPVTRSYTLTGDPGVAPATPPAAGPEVLASPAASGATQQRTPEVAGLSDGRYVVVWADNLTEMVNGILFHNGSYEIRAQIFNADGTKSGGVLDVSPFLGRDQTQPSVTGLANGRFVVTWTGYNLQSGLRTQVQAQFYNADGSRNGPAQYVRPSTVAEDQSNVASLFNGGAVVVQRVALSSGFTSIFAQRYAADGTPVGSGFQVGNTSTADRNPAAAGLQNGGFVVAYAEAYSASSTEAAIFVQVFGSDGTAGAGPIKVNTAGPVTFNGLDHPAVAVLQDGSFVVTYRNGPPSQGSGSATILAQHFSASGAPQGGELTVATNAFVAGYSISAYSPPAITALHDGGYAITWETAGSGNAAVSIQGQIFSADDTKQGGSFAVTPSTGDTYQSPAVTTLVDDRLLVVGSDYNGNGSDIRAESFSLTSNGSVSPTTYGRVLDGPVAGATVFADANGNGVLDPGEASATTDSRGRYHFTTEPSGPLVATGGTDNSTGLPFTTVLTAPEGSLSIDALSTLVQKVMAIGSLPLGEAMLRVDFALGLSLQTDATTANLITDTFNGVIDAPTALIANAVVLNTLILAKAAGGTGDLFGKLAGQIAAADYGVVDPTATSTLQALGLDPAAASTVSALAQAQASLLASKLAAGGTGGQALQSLVETVAGLDAVAQGAETADVAAAAAQGLPGPVAGKYTGSNLIAQVDATSAGRYATPFDVAYTDVTTNAIAYANGAAFDGGAGGATKLFVLPGDHSVAIGATASSIYLRSGAGTDALRAAGGSNVLDGGAGSSFLVGGTGGDGGADTFLMDASGGTTWSTIVNFHPGDAAWLFGFHDGLSTRAFTALDGVAGFQGLTLEAELGGPGTGANTALTFAGVDPAVEPAHFSYDSGTTLDGRDYLRITYNP